MILEQSVKAGGNAVEMIRIAVDALGGDYAPKEVVAGAILAARENPYRLILVGGPSEIEAELAEHDTSGLEIDIEPADDVIRMDEQPAVALRQKTKASILVSNGLVRDGRADASVTMGHTGAGMIAALWTLGRIEGISTAGGGDHVLRPSARYLRARRGSQRRLQAAVPPAIRLDGRHLHGADAGHPNPTVGLLSNGSEDNKGNELGREAFPLFKRAD